MVALNDAPILERIVGLDRSDMPLEAARFMLTLGFTDADMNRMNELSAKASLGHLTEAESREIDTFMLLSDFLAILKSKARMALRNDANLARE